MPEDRVGETMQDIEEAVRILLTGRMKRVEGQAFTAYTVGESVVRVDIKTAEATRV